MKLTANNTSLKDTALHAAHTIHRYIVLIFLLFVFSIYGYLGWRVFSLNQAEPDPADVSAQLKTASVPHIDNDVVAKIQQLQDNSVSVQSLFDEARQNPFQE